MSEKDPTIIDLEINKKTDFLLDLFLKKLTETLYIQIFCIGRIVLGHLRLTGTARIKYFVTA